MSWNRAPMRLSLTGRVFVAIVITAIVSAAATAFLGRWLMPAFAAAASLAISLPLGIWLGRLMTHSWTAVIGALRDGMASVRDHDYSISIARPLHDDLGDLVAAYNSVGDLLRRERLDLHQRELLLDTVIQTTPLALVLTNAADRIVFSNLAARQLLHGGRKLEGLELNAVLEKAPAPLRDAVAGSADTLFTMQQGAEAEVYHLSQRRFLLNAQPHRLLLLKQLTRELAAQEVAVWKKVIRVIAHELNNSLAPISSLANSGLMLTRDRLAADTAAGSTDPNAQADSARLQRVFTTIADRATHLATFIDGYARFAKLPQPKLARVEWRSFFARLEGTVSFRLGRPLPEGAATFDATQLEQVMINLLKNAAESGSKKEDIEVTVHAVHDGWMVEVADRGTGLSEDVLRDALLPFYSTKPSGTGLGLTLCREIVEAHDGRFSLANREGGGAVMTIWLPRLAAAHAEGETSSLQAS